MRAPQRLPLPSVCERAERFEDALGRLRDKQTLSGNDFLPLAVKLDDLLSHLAIQGEVVDAACATGACRTASPIRRHRRDATLRHRHGHHDPAAAHLREDRGRHRRHDDFAAASATQKSARLSDLSQESLEEMSTFLADMYSKRVSLVVVGLEDVPSSLPPHGREDPRPAHPQRDPSRRRNAGRSRLHDKPEIGTVAVQFARTGADGYQLSVQDDGRGLDHDKIRAEAVRQGVLTADAAATIDPRKLASLIFRPGFTTVGEGGARHRHGRGARPREQGRRTRGHRDEARRIHAFPHHAAAREERLRTPPWRRAA